jgi:hypothetical protein
LSGCRSVSTKGVVEVVISVTITVRIGRQACE